MTLLWGFSCPVPDVDFLPLQLYTGMDRWRKVELVSACFAECLDLHYVVLVISYNILGEKSDQLM